MSATFICKTHRVEAPAGGHGCEQCYADYESRRPAAEMTPDERVAELNRWVHQMSIPLHETKIRIDELVGRSVYNHEIGLAFEQLCEEARNPTDVVNMDQVIGIWESTGKPLIVVAGEAQ